MRAARNQPRQLDLFTAGSAGRPPANRTRTSQAAARAAEPASAGKREVIRLFVCQAGLHGATNDEIVAATGILLQTVCARVNELQKLGSLVDSGLTRPTRAGRAATVWRVRG